MFLHLPTAETVFTAQGKLLSSLQFFHFLGQRALIHCISAHSCPHISPAFLNGKSLWWNEWKLLFLITEISCIIGSSCSWVTSTDSFGKPDWVLSSVGVLVSQDRQQLLLENSSSRGDVEGRQSYSSRPPRLDTCFLPAPVIAVGSSNWSCQAETLLTHH